MTTTATATAKAAAKAIATTKTKAKTNGRTKTVAVKQDAAVTATSSSTKKAPAAAASKAKAASEKAQAALAVTAPASAQSAQASPAVVPLVPVTTKHRSAISRILALDGLDDGEQEPLTSVLGTDAGMGLGTGTGAGAGTTAVAAQAAADSDLSKPQPKAMGRRRHDAKYQGDNKMLALLYLLQPKWKLSLLYVFYKLNCPLYAGAFRPYFTELTPLAAELTLKDLVRDGLVATTKSGDGRDMRPHQQYQLTPKGRELVKLFAALEPWAERHMP